MSAAQPNINNPPAPAAAPTAAQPSPAPAVASGRRVRFAEPETYVQLYAARGDALHGDYTSFYSAYMDCRRQLFY